MIGTEFVKDRVTKEPAKELRDQIVHRCFERGLLTLGCGRSTIRFMPALMIERELVDEGLQIFESAVTETERQFVSG
jgi:4-aminobutyrate aminotransferase